MGRAITNALQRRHFDLVPLVLKRFRQAGVFGLCRRRYRGIQHTHLRMKERGENEVIGDAVIPIG